ncbi:MAG: hypothetical protein GY862_15375 [Gammaproteobacteria bacterium]|nr:hypothetical protein [Gammaproteobacteria bacterium]
MKDTEELITASVEDYLLGLADSIHHAQQQLSQMRITGQDGQGAIRYHLPRVDFELKMSFELATSATGGGSATNGGKSAVLRARPIGDQNSSSQSTAETASTIKGSFVAVPIEGGKPPPVMRTALNKLTERSLEVMVVVQSAAGEQLEGIEAQFNVDQDMSLMLNQVAGLGALQTDTNLDDGIVLTDANGQAVTTLRVGEEETIGSHVAVIVDVLGEIETIVFKVEA